jgi:hypothetical protein
MLFGRWLAVGVSAGMAFGAWRFLRDVVPPPIALIGAAVPLVFMPLNMFALSYNLVGGSLFLLGVLVDAKRAGPGERGRARTIAGGVLLGLSAAAYPPAIVAVATHVAVGLATRTRVDRWKRAAESSVGVLLGLAPVLLVALWSGPANVLRDLSFTAINRTPLLEKMLQTLAGMGLGVVRMVPLVLALGVYYLLRGRGTVARIALLAMPALCIPLYGIGTAPFGDGEYLYGSPYLLLNLAALALALMPAAWATPRLRSLYSRVWLPCSVLALVIAISAFTGYVNAGVGFMGCAIVAVAVHGALTHREGSGHWMALATAAWIPVILAMTMYLYGAVFMDAPVGALTHTVPSGPYAGLQTTDVRAETVAELEGLVGRYSAPGSKVLFYAAFPAGYLFGPSPGGTNSVWEPYYGDGAAALEYWRRTLRVPDVIFVTRGFIGQPVRPFFERLLARGYLREAQTPHFTVYVRTGVDVQDLLKASP